jgi:transcriptional regulator with GAF, ATPase, and Fis domain
VRVIAASNRNLQEEVRQGRFREDLFYRLNVFPLNVPPLRDRREDIPALVARFLAKSARKLGKTFEGVAPAFLERAMAYDWPGNVRELENVVERAAILSRSTLLDSPEPLATAPVRAAATAPAVTQATAAARTLLDVEREHIRLALERTQWVIQGERGAALALGVNPSTLRGRMRKLGIHKSR